MARVIYIKVHNGVEKISYSNVTPSKKSIAKFLETKKVMEGTRHYDLGHKSLIPLISDEDHKKVPGLIKAHEFLGRGTRLTIFHADPCGGQAKGGVPAPKSSVTSWLLFPMRWSYGIRASAVVIAEEK